MAGYIGTQAVSVNTTSATISDDLAVGDDALITGTLTTTAATVFSGGFASNDGSTISTADNTTQLTLISTDADSSAGPVMEFYRNSSSPADSDSTGLIYFTGKNDADEKVFYNQIFSQIQDASNGTEDSSIDFITMVAGTGRSRMLLAPTETVFNEASVDLDFRVESNINTNALFVDGATGNVEIGAGSDLITKTAGTSNFVAGVNAGNSIVSGGNYNVCVGDNAGTALTTGDSNTIFGYNAGAALTEGNDGNSLIGRNAGASLVGADYNVAIGYNALDADVEGSRAVAIGIGALGLQSFSSNNNNYNIAIGYASGGALNGGIQNTFVGGLAGDGTDDGAYNTAVGHLALSANCGNNNTAVGYDALIAATGASNTAIGSDAGGSVTSGSNNIFLGFHAGITGSPGGNIATGSNEMVLGDENISNAYIQVEWTVVSDQRDKTDFTDLDLGLDFVKALAPVTYKWDKRSKYGDKTADGYDLNAQTPDGTHKEDWLDVGFKAQEVEALEQAAGYNKSNKTNLITSLTGDGKQMGIQYSKFIPILVKAIQEQNALIVALTARVATLEG